MFCEQRGYSLLHLEQLFVPFSVNFSDGVNDQMFFLDYITLPQDRSAFASKCCLLCAFRYGFILVSLIALSRLVLIQISSCRIIGVQSFKGSLRRNCYISPTLGESNIKVSNAPCGGHIDPVSLNVTGYISSTGAPTTSKGYICPLGSVCLVCGH